MFFRRLGSTNAAFAPLAGGVAAPLNTVAPAVTGTTTEGQTLTTTDGTWTGSPTFTRQWYRALLDGANDPITDGDGNPIGVEISGATASTYVQVAADVGERLFDIVTASNAAGSVTAHSNVTAIVASDALWSPENLAVPPRLWVDGRDATFSGSNLATWPNRGSDGGGSTPTNTPTAGATINSLATVRFAAGTSQHAAVSLGAWSTGQFSWFGLFKIVTTPGTALLGKTWGATDGVAIYCGTGDATFRTGAMGDGYTGFPAAPAPRWYNSTYQFNDTNVASFGGQLGATNAGWKNGTAITLTSEATTAFQNYGASTWVVGVAGGGEALGGDLFVLMIFDYFLTTDERQKLEGYYHHLTGTQASLPGGHPYLSSPP